MFLQQFLPCFYPVLLWFSVKVAKQKEIEITDKSTCWHPFKITAKSSQIIGFLFILYKKKRNLEKIQDKSWIISIIVKN